jgi:predicted membrane protein
MKRMKRLMIRLACSVMGALTLPFAILTIYIECTRNLPFNTTSNGLDSDLPVLLACIGLGVASIFALPCEWLCRIFLAIASIPVYFFALAFYWFMYEMARTGIWV